MSSNPRKVACTTCRERKVKCDSAKPRCGRCAQYNVPCRFSHNTKQGKDEVSTKLKALNERMSQAETTLATHHTGLPQSLALTTSAEVFGDEALAAWPQVPASHIAAPHSDFNSYFSSDEFFSSSINQPNSPPTNGFSPEIMGGWTPTNTFTDALDMASTSVTSDLGLGEGSVSYESQYTRIQREGSKFEADGGLYDCQTEDGAPSWTTEAMSLVDHMQNLTRFESSREVPQNVTSDLYQTYFNTLHNVFPMVDKAAFFSKINSSDASTDFIGLKYAMWAYAATQSSSYSSMSKQFYLSAREFLERSEAESTSGVPTITDLQISILLAFYELTQTLFTRAWMSISRTTWLAQMLELHHMDHKSSSKSRPSSPYDSADHEERRRTFWAAYSLSCFSSVGIGWNTSNALDFQEISTVMPIHEAGAARSSRPLTLSQACKMSASQVLSPYQGMLLVSTICSLCCAHVKQLRLEGVVEYSSYDFWAQHYHLEETITHISTYALAHLTPDLAQLEPTVLSLNIILQASIICLHQAAIVKAEKSKVPNKQLARSQNLCLKATLEITKLMKLVGRACLVKMTPFVPWAVFVALQFLIRRSHGQERSGTPKPESPKDRSRGSDVSSNDARALDSMHLLFSALSNMKKTNPLARVFEDQLQKEMARGKEITHFVGLVNFPIARPAPKDDEDSDDDD